MNPGAPVAYPPAYSTPSPASSPPSNQDPDAQAVAYAREVERAATMRAEYRRLVADIYARDPMVSVEAAMKRADMLFSHFVALGHFAP
jgi:hypothetical protein